MRLGEQQAFLFLDQRELGVSGWNSSRATGIPRLCKDLREGFGHLFSLGGSTAAVLNLWVVSPFGGLLNYSSGVEYQMSCMYDS